MIPSRTNPNPQSLQKPSLPKLNFLSKTNFSLKQLETGISRKYGDKTNWMKKESSKQTDDDPDWIIPEFSQTKEVPQRNYNELIYEENFPL